MNFLKSHHFQSLNDLATFGHLLLKKDSKKSVDNAELYNINNIHLYDNTLLALPQTLTHVKTISYYAMALKELVILVTRRDVNLF